MYENVQDSFWVQTGLGLRKGPAHQLQGRVRGEENWKLTELDTCNKS